MMAQLLYKFLLLDVKLPFLVLKCLLVGITNRHSALVGEIKVLFVDRMKVLKKAAVFKTSATQKQHTKDF